jgi:hypothetical protein
MTTPTPPRGRPDTTVSPGPGSPLPDSFQTLVNTLQGLETVINRQTDTLLQQITLQARYQQGTHPAAGAAAAGMPSMNRASLRLLASSGAPTSATIGMTKITGLGALSSVEHAMGYAAQQVGEWIAGTPLYGEEQAGTGAPARPAGPGATPVGMPTSTGATGGAAARAATSGTGWPGGPWAPAPGGGGGPGVPGGPGGGGPPAAPGGAPAAPGPPGGGGAAPGGIMHHIGSRIALSGGSAGGIGSMVRKLPVIGLGVDLADKGVDFYQNQREAGRQFQEVEGGTNLGGQAERAHRAIYQLSMFGRMPEGASAEAFNAVTDLGYNRAAAGQAQQPQNRQSALNFIYHNYTQTGMDVDDSVKTLQIASQNATVSLSQVSTALEQVSNTAGKAGVNAQQMRQQFDQIFNTALQQGAGSSSPQLAQGLASQQAAYGKALASVNFGGSLSTGQQYLMAGEYGITPADTQYIQRTNPQQYQNMISGNALAAIQRYFTPEEFQSLQQMIAAQGGGGQVSGDDATAIGQQFLNQWQPQDSRLDENTLAAQMNALTGLNLSPGQVMTWIVGQVAGFGTKAAQQSGTGGAPVPAGKTSGAPTGQYGLAQSRIITTSTGRAAALAVNGASVQGQTWQQVLTSGSAPQTAREYLAQEKKTGQRNPVLESLLQSKLWGGDQVQVMTATGPRVMSYQNAMKYYPNELAAGNARFFSASGQTYLGTTGTFTGGLTDPAADVQAEETQRAGDRLGVALGRWQKMHPAATKSLNSQGSGTKGTVQVTLTQEARELLKLLPSNNDQAAASSTVPASPYVSQASR